MSPGKLPGMKGLVSGSAGKRHFKSELSVDMISPPLSDFRHTMHVGRGGDVFGDTSFLSNHGGVREPGSPNSTAGGSKTTRFLSRAIRHARHTPAPCPRAGSRDLSPPPPPISPIIKNAISLPHLNLDPPNGCLQRALFPSSPDSLYSYGLQSGFVTLPRLSRLDRPLQEGEHRCGSLQEGDHRCGSLQEGDHRCGSLQEGEHRCGSLQEGDHGCGSLQEGDHRCGSLQEGDHRCGSLQDNVDYSLPRSDSFSSFTVDLGPSLMSEVLGLIDNPSCLQMTNHSWAEENEEEEPSAGFDLAVESSVQSSLVRAHANHRGRSSSSELRKEDGMSVRMPDASMGSPLRAEPTMEAERFQRAADVLARHYGGGSFNRGRSQSQEDVRSTSSPSSVSAFPEEEEEIKV